MSRARSVAIIHGWAEGPWQSRKFRDRLLKHELFLSDDIDSADVIVAHSEGCYWIPDNRGAKRIILIGLPFWPDRSLAGSVVRKLVSEVSFHRKDESFDWWLNKMGHNIWYILSRPRDSYRVITKHKVHYLPDGHKHSVTLVRPAQDTFCHPDVSKLIPEANEYKFVEVPGAHDDCWLKPEPYIELLLKEL